MRTRSHAIHNAEGLQEPPPPDQQQPQEFLITRDALKVMLEEAASRAAAEEIAHYLASLRQNQEGNQNLNHEVPQPHPPGKSHTEKEGVGTNNVQLSNARKGKPFQEEEANRHGPAHHGLHTEWKGESSLEILPARRSPFTTAILAEVLPVGVKITNLPEYDGTGDPKDHLDRFYAKSDLYDFSNAAYCKIFRTTLSGHALAWFNKLPPRTIESLEQLTQRFLHQLSINRKYPKTAAYLFSIIQKEGESLREFVQRFIQTVHEVPHVNHDLLAGIMQQNLLHKNFKESIVGKPTSSLGGLMERAGKYIRIEESADHCHLGKRMRGSDRLEGMEKGGKQVAEEPRLRHL